MLGSSQPFKQQFAPMSIRNMQELVPAGHSKFHRKFLKPIPKVLLITEIKMQPHYPCAEQCPGTDPKAAQHLLILP